MWARCSSVARACLTRTRVCQLPSSSLLSASISPSSLSSIYHHQPVRHATKKSGGSTQNSSGTAGRRLGLKKTHGEFVPHGSIVIRQRGLKWHPGINMGVGNDHTLYAKCDGRLIFTRAFRSWKLRTTKWRVHANILPIDQEEATLKEYWRNREALDELAVKLQRDKIKPLSLTQRRRLAKAEKQIQSKSSPVSSTANPSEAETSSSSSPSSSSSSSPSSITSPLSSSSSLVSLHSPAASGSPLQVYYELERRVNELGAQLTVSMRWTAEEKRDYRVARDAIQAARAIPKPKPEVKPWNPQALPASIYIRPSF